MSYLIAPIRRREGLPVSEKFDEHIFDVLYVVVSIKIEMINQIGVSVF